MNKSRFLTVTAMIFAAALSRLMPHPWNVTPVAAMALFAGARFDRITTAFVVPLTALFISDLILGFHRTLPFVYLGFFITVLMGLTLRNRKHIGMMAAASAGSSFVFFLVTNFGYWLLTPAFSKNISGLAQCYIVAIPFFRNSLAGDLMYTGLLFGAFSLAEALMPSLKSRKYASPYLSIH